MHNVHEDLEPVGPIRTFARKTLDNELVTLSLYIGVKVEENRVGGVKFTDF